MFTQSALNLNLSDTNGMPGTHFLDPWVGLCLTNVGNLLESRWNGKWYHDLVVEGFSDKGWSGGGQSFAKRIQIKTIPMFLVQNNRFSFASERNLAPRTTLACFRLLLRGPNGFGSS